MASPVPGVKEEKRLFEKFFPKDYFLLKEMKLI